MSLAFDIPFYHAAERQDQDRKAMFEQELKEGLKLAAEAGLFIVLLVALVVVGTGF